MRYHLSIAGLTLGAMILAVPSLLLAAPRCGDTAELDQTLAPAKGFIRLGRGTTSDGILIDVYVAPMTASWLAVARLTTSRSCIITEGKSWQSDVPFSIPALPFFPSTSPTSPESSSASPTSPGSSSASPTSPESSSASPTSPGSSL